MANFRFEATSFAYLTRRINGYVQSHGGLPANVDPFFLLRLEKAYVEWRETPAEDRTEIAIDLNQREAALILQAIEPDQKKVFNQIRSWLVHTEPLRSEELYSLYMTALHMIDFLEPHNQVLRQLGEEVIKGLEFNSDRQSEMISSEPLTDQVDRDRGLHSKTIELDQEEIEILIQAMTIVVDRLEKQSGATYQARRRAVMTKLINAQQSNK